MRRTCRPLLGLAILCLMSSPALGQAETLIQGNATHGGFGGPVLRFTAVDGTAALLTGGRGGWIINVQPDHALILGGGGYGLVTDVRVDGFTEDVEGPLYLNLGYGGFILEYVNNTNRLLHFSLEALIGGGGANYRDDKNDTFGPEDAFFVVEPGLNAILNVTTFFRLGAGVSYRFISGTQLETFSDSDLGGLTGVLTFKFGKF